ncbi:S8 family serine peptidase [Sediminitomix flava]|uniref:Putative secreted protein (Por secretion system target) n=1 Tax=Sediminitomix flava TaxID=379075 RepID=A0A315ZEF1_SEDFL|nr:S8 family serine peptidase [Sediminitomix flava]PWJ43712.1 putative secreted protein (Por secretion system target) [Sediminitomix flava]
MMRRCLLFVFLSLCCIISSHKYYTATAQGRTGIVNYNNQGQAKGIIRVKFAESTADKLQTVSYGGLSTGQLGIASFDAVSKQFNGHHLERVFPYDAKFEHKLRKHGLHLWYNIEYDLDVDPTVVCRAYNNVETVELSEPILEKRLIGGEKGVRVLSEEEVAAITANASASMTMDDPLLSSQWHYFNDGSQAGKRADASIQLDKAWAEVTGSTNVIVAVTDGGIDVDHEDLRDNMWINEAELNGEDGVDDDGNGYIDDVYGYNFTNNSGNIDPETHGTHVAGTVAAVNNNGVGVAGVAGGSGNGDGVRIMACQILSEGGGGGDLASAFIYAANNGAVISQNSWGYLVPGQYEQSVLDAIDYFIAEAGDYEGSPMRGGIVIFAAGNDGRNAAYYPGYYESVVAVASTDGTRDKASYSNFGSWIEIAAPGGDTWQGQSYGVLSTLPGNEYGYLDGTSMACPHVSGIAALVVSKLGGGDFSQDVLKNQIVFAGLSLDETAPDFIGQLGTGLIDASLAIKENSGIGPEVTTGLIVSAISNDFVDLNWTVPADEDDEKPSKFKIILSEGAFDENTAREIFVFSDVAAGETYEYRIEELTSSTDYSLKVQAFDRWGNPSDLSEELTFTTNMGPAMTYPEAPNSWSFAIDLDGDVTESTVVVDTFMIGNTNDALLEWELETRQTDVYVKSWANASLGYPQNADISLERSRVMPLDVVRNEDYEPLREFKNEYLYYTESFYAVYLIGDEDLSKSNTIAAAYSVSNPDGFNITEMDVYLNNISTGKATVEIYHGDILADAKLVLSKEIEDTQEGSHTISLDYNESYYVQQNDILWLVVKVPAGNRYPIGISSITDHPDAERYQWISFDDGTSWNNLADALQEPGWAFTMGAFTDEEYQGDFISLTPAKGMINGVGETEVEFSADISHLKNGDVETNILIKSNDENAADARISTKVTIAGQEPNLITPGIVDFGSVQVGSERELIIRMENYGYGLFKGSFTFEGLDGSPFEIVSKPYNVMPRTAEDLVVKYVPTTPGNSNAVLSITDRNGYKAVVNLFGNGEAPAEIAVTPQSQVHYLAHGAAATSSIMIKNEGDYPLDFNIPKYSSKPSKEGGHKFGYAWELRNDGFTWEEIDGMDGTVDVTDQFKSNPFLDFVEVDLSFKFPFYDTLVNKLYMSHIGLIALDDKDPVNGSWGGLLGSSFTSNGYFAIYYQYFDLLHDTKLLYHVFDDHVVFEYKNVHSKVTHGLSGEPMNFQLAVYYDGHAEMRYLDVYWSDADIWDPMMGIESPDKQDGIYFYDVYRKPERLFGYWAQPTWIDITFPGSKIISNLSHTNGVVAVGDSLEITFDIDTDGLVEGVNTQNIAIENNDPSLPIAHFTVNVDINEGGEAIVSTSDNTVDFGSIYRGTDLFRVISFLNDGNSNADIVSTSFADGSKFSVNKETFELKARLGTTVKVYFDASELGEYSDQITFTDDMNNTYVFDVSANVIGAPAIDLTYDQSSFTLNHGEKAEFTVNVSNVAGDTTLRMLTKGSNWLYEKKSDVGAMSLPSLRDFEYYFNHNDDALIGLEDPDAPLFDWIEIVTNGEGQKLDFDQSIMSAKIDFEKPFMFYGEEYSTAWMGYPGIITFTEPVQLAPIINNVIPFEDKFNNFIAVFWGLTGYDYFDENDMKGIYFKEFEDKAVFTYYRWVHSFGEGNGGLVEAQVVLYLDGRIKMQYKTINQETIDQWNHNLVVGVENIDGTEGTMANFYRSLIKDNLVIEFTPSEVINIAAGESKDITFELNATELIGGDYVTNLTFVNHTPNSEDISIPVNLTVNGESALSWNVEELDLGDVLYQPGWWTRHQFAIENKGTAHHTLAEGEIEVISDSNLGLEFWGTLEEVNPWLPFPAIPGFVDYNLFLNPFYKPLVIKVNEVVDAQVVLKPTEPGVYEDTLKLNYADGSMHELLVKANFYLPPVFESDMADTLAVVAMVEDHQEEMSFNISNKNGEYPLHYQFAIDYQYQGEVMMPDFSSSASAVALMINEFVGITSYANAVADSNFYQALYYGAEDIEISNSLGYGGSQEMTSMTKFIAPEGGFGLSHVSTWYRPEGLENGKIKVEVMTGTIDNLVTLHTETFTTETSSSEQTGKAELFELSEEVLFFSGENIYVAFTYEADATYPQGLIALDQTYAETFYFVADDGLIDITTDTRFATTGYYARAYAQDKVDGTWFKLSHDEGVIEMGDSLDVTASFDARFRRGANELIAKVAIITNDPDLSEDESSFIASMYINKGPQVYGNVEKQSMNEGDTLMLSYNLMDPESHDFTISIENLDDLGTATIEGNQVNISLTPSFDHSGMHSFDIVGVDEYGITTTATIDVEVMNVNRAPVAEEIDTIVIDLGEVFYWDATQAITDPDGDELTYGIADNNDGIVVSGFANNEFIISAIKEGETEIAITAYDPEMASVVKVVSVIVREALVTGVEDEILANKFKLMNYPNPVTASTKFSFDLTEAADVKIMVYNMQGQLVDSIEAGRKSVGTSEVEYDTSVLQSGMYIYTLIIDGTPKVFNKLIK